MAIFFYRDSQRVLFTTQSNKFQFQAFNIFLFDNQSIDLCSEDVSPGASLQPRPHPAASVPLCARLPPPLPRLPRPLGDSAPGVGTSEAGPQWPPQSRPDAEAAESRERAGPGEAGASTPRGQAEEAGPQQVSREKSK